MALKHLDKFYIDFKQTNSSAGMTSKLPRTHTTMMYVYDKKKGNRAQCLCCDRLSHARDSRKAEDF